MNKYKDIYKSISSECSSFFIGANSPLGFTYADQTVLSEHLYKRFYVIKGGPGCGKSSFMKRLRHQLTASGARATSYYCSSDPDSLDAVILEKNGKRVLIADGTSPHSLDLSLPGAVSELIDLGQFWDRSFLESHLDDIASHSAEKSLSFDRCRRYLASAKEIRHIITCSAEKAFLPSKARGAIRRLISGLPSSKGECHKATVMTCAISMKGAVRLNTFDHAENVIAVCDDTNMAPVFFRILSAELERSGHSQLISVSPLGDIAEIYLPDVETSFVPFSSVISSRYSKIIRLSRFTDTELISGGAAKRHFNEKCLISLIDGALESLSEAKEHHFALEKIYTDAMDFSRLDTFADSFIDRATEILYK